MPKPFPKGFRRDVIAVARQGDQSIAQVAMNLGVFESCLARWLKIADREDGVSGPRKYVEMRAEMDVLALISNCPQLNNPCNGYNPTPIEVLIWDPGGKDV